MALSDAQLAALARDAGWKGPNLAIAVAVALAESGGRPEARGDEDKTTDKWGPSVGLWQIRSLNAEKGTGGTRDELANADPAVNARHAYAIWQADGWGPWTTFGVGDYLLFMPRASSAVAGLPIPPGAGAVAEGAGAVIDSTAGAILDVAREPLRWLEWLKNPDNIKRILQVGIGAVVLIAGVSIVVAGALPGVKNVGVSEGKKLLKEGTK